MSVPAWPSTAPVEIRASGAVALVSMLTSDDLDLAARCRIEAALTVAASDPAPRVRLALAEAISTCPAAPVQVIAQLATDRPDIAGIVLARSPVVTQADLVDLAPRLDPRVLPMVAARARDASLAALLVEIGEAPAAAALLDNPSIELGAEALERMADLYGHVPDVRERLLRRDHLPIAARYVLVERLCSVLSATNIVSNVLGTRRTEAIMHDAEGAAIVASARGRPTPEIELLVDEVLARGGIDASLLMRALCHGADELFVVLVARLSSATIARARSALAGRRDGPRASLLERCDLTPEVAAMIGTCCSAALAGGRRAGVAELTAAVLERCKPVCRETAALAVLVRRWHVEALRRGGIDYARGVAQAA